MYNYQKIIATFFAVLLFAFLFKLDDKKQKSEVSDSVNIEKVKFIPTKLGGKNIENLICKNDCSN